MRLNPCPLLQRLLVIPAVRLICRPLRVEGAEHLCDLRPPLLLVANHTSHLDTPLLLAALPPALRRRVAVAAAADYWFRRPLLGTLARLLVNAFPVARRGCARASLDRCRALAAGGWALLVYPEGTRSPDGALQPFKAGVGLLAVELGVPVVPVVLAGGHARLPRGARWPRRGPAAVCFGPPLRFASDVPRDVAASRISTAVGVLHCCATMGAVDDPPGCSSAPPVRGGEERDGHDTSDHDAVQRGRHPARPAVQDPAPRALRVQL